MHHFDTEAGAPYLEEKILRDKRKTHFCVTSESDETTREKQTMKTDKLYALEKICS
jgi:hypothetical protein